jgi:hypothetical protein
MGGGKRNQQHPLQVSPISGGVDLHRILTHICIESILHLARYNLLKVRCIRDFSRVNYWIQIPDELGQFSMQIYTDVR